MAESCKTLTIVRRMATGIYREFQNPVLDVGCGPDTPSYDWPARVLKAGGPAFERTRYDMEHGDAEELNGIEDGAFGTVYASHILEHLQDPRTALRNWLRATRIGGSLFIAVPHRRLYECDKDQPPSMWAGDQHLWFFDPDRHRSGKSLGLAELLLIDMPRIWEAQGMEARLAYFATCDWGYERPAGGHPRGEYQIEAALVRLK